MPLNEINISRYGQILAKLLGMKENPAAQLATEIFPQLVLETQRPEWEFLGGSKLCQGAVSTGAVVGQQGHHKLLNPFGSGTLVILERVTFGAFSSREVVAGTSGSGTLANGPFQTAVRDARFGPLTIWPAAVPQTAAQLFTANAVGSAHVNECFRAQNVVLADLPVTPVILVPGTAYVVTNVTLNSTCSVTWQWRERVLQPDEVLGGGR